MGHNLQAFVAMDNVAEAIQASHVFPFIARLPFGLSLIPIDEQWIGAEDEKIADYKVLGLPDYAMYGGKLWMEPVIAKVGVDHSMNESILFVRTEWFGGSGDSQGWWFEKSRIMQVGVNEGLLRLGVRPRLGSDAWDAVGLLQYRSSDWDSWKRKRDGGLLVHTRNSLPR